MEETCCGVSFCGVSPRRIWKRWSPFLGLGVMLRRKKKSGSTLFNYDYSKFGCLGEAFWYAHYVFWADGRSAWWGRSRWWRWRGGPVKAVNGRWRKVMGGAGQWRRDSYIYGAADYGWWVVVAVMVVVVEVVAVVVPMKSVVVRVKVISCCWW